MAQVYVFDRRREQDILGAFKAALARGGYKVDGFTDPGVALEHFRAHTPRYSRITTDVRMPSMSGVEFARHARRIRQGIKVLVMTAFEVDRDLRAALPVAEQGFLQKPFRTAKICAAVKRCRVA